MRPAVVTLLRAVAVAAAAVLTVSLAARHPAVLPDLTLVVVLVIGLRSGVAAGTAWGLVAGWCVDLVPPGTVALGSAALLYAAAGAFAGWCHRRDRVGIGWIALVALLGAAGVRLAWAVVALARAQAVDWATVGADVLATAALAAVVVPVVLGAERRLVRRRAG